MQTNPELSFKEGNPGAVQYGNFINYYQFHPPENRLNLLPEDLWNKDIPFIGLDLGCNAGDLTISLHNFINERVPTCKILGVDIDPTLIERCREKKCGLDINFHCLDFMESGGQEFIRNYLDTAQAKRFNAVFCFSITMWIHLNHGDEGLKRFLQHVSNLGQLIVIEPQPWKCYRSAVKRMRLSNAEFPQFKQLKIRGNVEEDIAQFLIHSCNLVKIYESPRTKWGRKLLIFRHS